MENTQTRWYSYIEQVTHGAMAKDVAAKAGFDQSALTRWKKGMPADPKFVVQFARAYGLNVLEALAASELITDAEASIHEVRIGAQEIPTRDLLDELARRIDMH